MAKYSSNRVFSSVFKQNSEQQITTWCWFSLQKSKGLTTSGFVFRIKQIIFETCWSYEYYSLYSSSIYICVFFLTNVSTKTRTLLVTMHAHNLVSMHRVSHDSALLTWGWQSSSWTSLLLWCPMIVDIHDLLGSMQSTTALWRFRSGVGFWMSRYPSFQITLHIRYRELRWWYPSIWPKIRYRKLT